MEGCKKNKVLVALGSNMDFPQVRIQQACAYIRSYFNLSYLNASPYFKTKPWGDVMQDDFLNKVVCWEDARSPWEVYEGLMCIERLMGRRRTVRWGPRTIDLDLIKIGCYQVNTPQLILPHPLWKSRQFVWEPMYHVDVTDEIVYKWFHERDRSLSCRVI